MLLSVDQVVPVADVPVGKFFYMKPQNGEARLAFMAQQDAAEEGHFAGPVVLTFPIDGRFTMPRPAKNFPLAIAAILSDLTVVVDSNDLVDSSTEALGVPAGRVLLSGKHKLVTFQWGDLDEINFVNLDTGKVHLSSDAGEWLSFKRWHLQSPDGTVLFQGQASDPPDR